MEKVQIATGIFGGTFNPIHIGHLALANYLCEYSSLDELWLIVSPQNPFKRDMHLLDDDMRLEMVRAALADYPKMSVSDIEFRLPRPSYMITTLRNLAASYPDRKFSLVIGADNWASFPRWKASDEILSDFNIIIYPRPGYCLDPSALPPNAKIVCAPLFEISSTFIRQAIAQGKDIRYFLHPKVYEIIDKLGLYKN